MSSSNQPSIQLYDNKFSIHATYARVVLDEVGIKYSKVHTELPFENLTPKYAAISEALSVPAMTIKENGKTSNLTDSRDIIMYCKDLPGAEALFPKDKMKDIEQVLDQIYSANGGQLSFQSQIHRDPYVFNSALNVVGNIRTKTLKNYRDDPNNAPIKECYEAAVKRNARPNPSLEELSTRANKVMTFLDQKLEESKDTWLLGQEHTAADSVAAVWVQWVVWAKPPTVILAPRVLKFLERAKERPAWKVTDAGFVIHMLTTRIYGATAVAMAALVGGIAWSVLAQKE